MEQEKEKLKSLAKEFYKSAPITTHQIAIGLGLSLFRNDYWKFHPYLIASPKWQIYRGLSCFLITGDNLGEALASSIGLAFNYSLESSLSTQKNHLFPARYPILDKINKFLSRFVKNPYLKAQIISGIVILALEFLFYKPKSLVNPTWINAATEFLQNNILPSADLTRVLFLNPVSLYNILDSSMKWIWSFMNCNRQFKFRDIHIHPIWIPIISTFIFGKDGFYNNLKGFFAAIIVSEVLNLRNSDGEHIVDSGLVEISKTISSLLSRIYQFVNS